LCSTAAQLRKFCRQMGAKKQFITAVMIEYELK
jgi:hypothetical protein